MKHYKMMILFIFCSTFSVSIAKKYVGEALFIHNLSLYVPVPNSILLSLNTLAAPFTVPKLVVDPRAKKMPLFKKYPAFKNKIPYISLCTMPSPVQKLIALGHYLKWADVTIKRDDQLGLLLQDGKKLFGGTKLRKLGFLLGDAVHNGAKSVLTFGSAGSNHTVATAACCQQVGLKNFSLLKPQPNSQTVRRNLLLMNYYGSNIQYCPNIEVRGMGATYTFFRQKEDYGDFPYVIPPGGSCPMGIIGIIDAVLELKEQIKQGQLSEPDRIYLAAGTLGTVAGLLLGTKIANLSSKVIGICVMPEMKPEGAKKMILQLCKETVELLHSLDATFPLIKINEEDIHMLYDFRGTQYGLFTPEAAQAIKIVKEKEGIVLDGTYTGKAFAGMLEDVEKHNYQHKNILFWHTFYGDACTQEIADTSYKKLPKALHYYFETSVQALDV